MFILECSVPRFAGGEGLPAASCGSTDPSDTGQGPAFRCEWLLPSGIDAARQSSSFLAGMACYSGICKAHHLASRHALAGAEANDTALGRVGRTRKDGDRPLPLRLGRGRPS